MKWVLLSSLLLILNFNTVNARPYPRELTRNIYHNFYVETYTIEQLPFKLPGFSFKVGQPARLLFITGYTGISLHPQNLIDPPIYTPTIMCHLKGNIPIYEGWRFIVAVNIPNIEKCQ